jgi:hypothetical protein
VAIVEVQIPGPEATNTNVWTIFLFGETTFQTVRKVFKHNNIYLTYFVPEPIIEDRSSVLWKSQKQWFYIVTHLNSSSYQPPIFGKFPEMT